MSSFVSKEFLVQLPKLPSLTSDIVGFLHTLGISKAYFVGHSFAGAELSVLATYFPQRISGMIFLDAVSTQADDEKLAATMPAPFPEPTSEDVASFGAYRSWLRANMFAGKWSNALEEDLRATTLEESDGSIRPKMPDRVATELMAADVDLQSLGDAQCPVLSIHAITDRFPGFDSISDPALKADVDYWVRDVAVPLQRAIAARFQKKVPHAKVVQLERANHFCFIDREDDVAKIMLDFLDG